MHVDYYGGRFSQIVGDEWIVDCRTRLLWSIPPACRIEVELNEKEKEKEERLFILHIIITCRERC